MSAAETVAEVLLVAQPSRQRELAPCLRVEAEDVRYAVRVAAPAEVGADPGADVVLIDGESFIEDRSRLGFLRRVGARPRRATILYVCSRVPLESELDYAGAWADDFVYPGWAHAERVRRRVQVVALAPWRRASALRERAERLGERRLRLVLGTGEGARPAADRDAGSGGLAQRAFEAGHRSGATAVARAVDRRCEQLLAELRAARGALSPDLVREIDAAIRESAAAASPVVAARARGAHDAIAALRGHLSGILRDELGELDPRPTRWPSR